ncbi:hypothetical protein COEREDRAFT_86323 [Coemansia reversa NRRL 1564]|uniref:Arrestin-like N-terminal domain-containing protein n=1 Tax=Coemansia reversa (strain ATCC 12441 / NRRL 1564) TaxID=763665 RepID=A0A2G5BEA9_COERN|nr:hypothetical protein COEREDRAFT_86323 [Coemansia reversa NRRL 1564]|eukprot:PIA17332.1 hypothetical protein COEREDRAFT_86323 [Coemansia reversa NRRL 1564]
MILPSVRVFALGDVVLEGAPDESRGHLIDGRVIVTVRVATRVRSLDVVFQTTKGRRWGSLRRIRNCNNDFDDNSKSVAISEQLYCEDKEWSRGTYEFFFRIEIPGDLRETMFTAHGCVAYEVRATLATGGMRRSTARPVAVKRVPYVGAAWESLTSDVVHVSAVWRDRIEMCALGCSRVQRDDQPLRVTGVVRALEKGFRLTRVGFVLEERTRCRTAASSVVVASRFLRPGEHGSWCHSPIVDQLAFDVELQIPRAYRRIHYDVKHGPVTVSHRLAFVVAVVDESGHGTSLRLFTPLHIMPRAADAVELPTYTNAAADRLLLASA